MTIRTAISVSKPFTFRNPDDIQPAGGYLLDTDEELIEGLSGLAYRRVTTFLHLPSILVSKTAPSCARSTLRNSMRRWKKV